MTVTVRAADLNDVEAVRAVGFATWPPTYGPIHGDAYVERGLARWWSPEVVARGITEAPLRTYVAVDDQQDVIGCAVIGELDDAPMLWKLYVSQGFHEVGEHGTGEDAEMRMERLLP